jgi:hypothetical protein
VAHAFPDPPERQVFPACRGARAVAQFTSDTASAWYFDGRTGALIGHEEQNWGPATRYGRGVSLHDCTAQAAKHQ